MINFKIPKKVCSDFEGYSFFAKLNHDIEQCFIDKIIFDFVNNNWFEANLCSILGALINKAQNNLNDVELLRLNKGQEDIFSRNNFLAAMGGQKITDYNNTTIKYRKNSITEEKLIKKFLDDELINKPDFPKLSSAARNEIIRSIFEIYNNAVLHGDCNFIYSCGQFYPKKTPPRIDFTIVDLGNTIQSNVNNFLKRKLSGVESIIWALKEENTTKPLAKNIPGGLGFPIIRNFVKLNKGKVQIISSNGFWEFNKDKENSKELEFPFPGTIVNLEFNLDDASFYYLRSEIVEDIIF